MNIDHIDDNLDEIEVKLSDVEVIVEQQGKLALENAQNNAKV